MYVPVNWDILHETKVFYLFLYKNSHLLVFKEKGGINNNYPSIILADAFIIFIAILHDFA